VASLVAFRRTGTAGGLSSRSRRSGGVPLLYVYLWFDDRAYAAISILIVAGILMGSARPIQLALMQEMLPEARGPASGVLLAFQFIVQSGTTLGFGTFADAAGIETTFWIVLGLALPALLSVALLLAITSGSTHARTDIRGYLELNSSPRCAAISKTKVKRIGRQSTTIGMIASLIRSSITPTRRNLSYI